MTAFCQLKVLDILVLFLDLQIWGQLKKTIWFSFQQSQTKLKSVLTMYISPWLRWWLLMAVIKGRSPESTYTEAYAKNSHFS